MVNLMTFLIFPALITADFQSKLAKAASSTFGGTHVVDSSPSELPRRLLHDSPGLGMSHECVCTSDQ